MNFDLLQEIVCQAHMEGQYNQSGVDPSWSEAFAYWIKEVKPNIGFVDGDIEKMFKIIPPQKCDGYKKGICSKEMVAGGHYLGSCHICHNIGIDPETKEKI